MDLASGLPLNGCCCQFEISSPLVLNSAQCTTAGSSHQVSGCTVSVGTCVTRLCLQLEVLHPLPWLTPHLTGGLVHGGDGAACNNETPVRAARSRSGRTAARP